MSATFALCASTVAEAQVRTLTDQLGRTIRAEVLSVDGDTVKVKRDDGQVFNMPLANLSDDDQLALKKWAKANPPVAQPAPEPKVFVPTATSLTLGVNRTKFGTELNSQSTYYKDGYEEWGYNVQLTNTTLHPIENLRVEYKIFGRLYGNSTQTDQSGSETLEPLGSRKSVSFRSKGFRFYKARSTDGYYNSAGGIIGVWVRVYHGKTLLQEYASPDSIKTKEKWTSSVD